MTGLSPPSSRSRSSAGAVRSTGIWAPAGRIPSIRAVDEFEVTVADKVEVPDLQLWCPWSARCLARRRTSPARCFGLQGHPLTVPTRMPATRTVSPVFSRDASLKTAE